MHVLISKNYKYVIRHLIFRWCRGFCHWTESDFFLFLLHFILFYSFKTFFKVSIPFDFYSRRNESYARYILWNHYISWGLNFRGFRGYHQQRIYTPTNNGV